MEEEIREDGTPEGASHYQKTSIQPIEMFQQIFPKEMVYRFCVCNAFKYLYRLKQKGQEAKEKRKEASQKGFRCICSIRKYIRENGFELADHLVIRDVETKCIYKSQVPDSKRAR